MITQEQYDQLNEGDTVTARYAQAGLEFDVMGKVYDLYGLKHLAVWDLAPKHRGPFWTITEHIPATPAWHSAQVISAVNPEGKRLVYMRHPHRTDWWTSAGGVVYVGVSLKDVKILVDKDVEL